jgi:hypothetical protein
MPAIILNSSPARWVEVPVPPDATLSLPALSLAYAMNSGRLLTGIDGCTTMTLGTRISPATGAMSRMKLKLSFSYSVALIALAALTSRSV